MQTARSIQSAPPRRSRTTKKKRTRPVSGADPGAFHETRVTRFVSLGEMTGEILIENALKLVAESPTPDSLEAKAAK